MDSRTDDAQSTPVKVLLPHELLHAVAQSGSFAFNSLMLGNLDSESRKNFWQHVALQTPWKDHPVVKNGDWGKLIPVCIHGDGAQMFREDEYFCWSWSSVFSSCGCIKDFFYRWPICVIPERHMRRQSDPC